MNRTPLLIPVLSVALSLLAEGGAPPAHAEDVGPFGPPLGVKADVVRSFSLKTSGAVAKEVKGAKGDGKTGLPVQPHDVRQLRDRARTDLRPGADDRGVRSRRAWPG